MATSEGGGCWHTLENSVLSELAQLYFEVFECRENRCWSPAVEELEKFADLLEILLQSCDWFKQKELFQASLDGKILLVNLYDYPDVFVIISHDTSRQIGFSSFIIDI